MTKLLQYFQEKVVFLPTPLAKEYQFDFDVPFDEHFWETPYEGLINALHFRVQQPHGIIVYYHGNADNLSRWGNIAKELTSYGYDVLLMDYRGYGKSTGPRSEKVLYADAQFVYDFATAMHGEENTVVYGRSLGGAFAVKTGADNNPKAVILEAAFYNLQDVVNQWLPGKVTDRVSPKMTYHFLSNRIIKQVSSPLYQFHGTKDRTVPLRSGKKLFELFESAHPHLPKKFIEIGDGHHDDLSKSELYQLELQTILQEKP